MDKPITVNVANLAAYTPQETVEIVSRAGVKKGKMRPDKIFFSAISAGCLLSFAAGAFLNVTTSPWLAENAPGLLRTIGGLLFPLGIVMIILTGADLFTGTCMYTTVAVLHGRLPVTKMLMHWFICFWGNLIGSVFTMYFIFGLGGVFDAEPYLSTVQNFVYKKQVVPTFVQIFFRGIGCNWLVCLACLLSMQAKDVSGKIMAMWWPIFAFASLGLDHVVANMFIVPLGLFLRTDKLTIPLYLWKGILPAGLGNIIGGAVFCGMYYWYMHLLWEPEIAIDGVKYEKAPAPPRQMPFPDLEHKAGLHDGLSSCQVTLHGDAHEEPHRRDHLFHLEDHQRRRDNLRAGQYPNAI